MFNNIWNQNGGFVPPPNNGYQGIRKPHRPTKKELQDFIAFQLNASEVIRVDDFETLNTRHICMGTKKIQILSKQPYIVPSEVGNITVEIVYCPQCRKLLLNKNSLEII